MLYCFDNAKGVVFVCLANLFRNEEELPSFSIGGCETKLSVDEELNVGCCWGMSCIFFEVCD